MLIIYSEEARGSISIKLRRGFSLVEMLVVFAVLIILAGLLFPVFSRVRMRAVQSSCASNLHQIGMAVHLYVQDNDGLYPYGVNARSKETGDSLAPAHTLRSLPLYQDLLRPYTHSSQVFACPGDNGFYDLHANAFKAWGSSYFYNEFLTFDPQDTRNADPSRLAVCEDALGIWHGDDPNLNVVDQRINVVFNDLHVKRVPFLDTAYVGP